MALGWILYCAMKTLGSYILLVEIFYQLLIQTLSFSRNIYLTIDNMIIITHLIMIFLTSIVHIQNHCFEFINPHWLLNNKGRSCQNMLKIYRKQLYQQKLKIRKFFPTNNQLLEKTDEATRPKTNKLSDNWDDLFKNIVNCHQRNVSSEYENNGKPRLTDQRETAR